MKDFFKGLMLITLSLLLFPAIPYAVGMFYHEDEVIEVSSEIAAAKQNEDYIAEVYVYDTVAEKEIVLTTEEYIAAALAPMYSPNADQELLKAQAVLMYTYILRRRKDEALSPTPDLHGCDISTDGSQYPRLMLGKDMTFDYENFRAAARAVKGVYCSYGGEPISVAYCYSAGLSTESAETVLGEDIPYLQAHQTSEPDAYFTTVTYPSDEVFARLTTSDAGYVLLGSPSGWITEKETAPSGYVKSVYLDSRFIVSGSEIARLLNLPSARFTFRYSESTDRFVFTVSGSGSLVGMSQRGAGVLAAQGYSYQEILKYYFDGIEIVGGF